MQILKTVTGANAYVAEVKKSGKTIGFVPTMGALHAGHLALLNRATLDNDIVACSIFVNPIQFNNKDDLKNYPRPIADDIHKLEDLACDMLFYPDVSEMYPDPVIDKYDFGMMDKVMEGKFRPGHFNGVAVVVRKLFEILTPDRAYFGLKDYQQLRIIETMTGELELPVEIVACPTVRANDGLAMSSRNARLSAQERRIAPAIYKVLNELKNKAGKSPVKELEQWATGMLGNYEDMNVEYLQIVDAKTLLPISDWNDSKNVVVCTAVHLGKVRLIDNVVIF